jgi:tetratricopeptide (TPR) repeat protein
MVRGEAAARLAEAHQSPLYLAWAYHLIALIHGRQGNTKEQLAYYQKALPLWQRGGDSLGLSSSLYSLGSLYYNQGQYDEAEKYYRRALQLREPLPYDERTAYAYEGLGLVAHARQNY